MILLNFEVNFLVRGHPVAQNGQNIEYPKRVERPLFDARFSDGNIMNYTLNNNLIERFKPEVRWLILNLIPASNSEGLIILI